MELVTRENWRALARAAAEVAAAQCDLAQSGKVIRIHDEGRKLLVVVAEADGEDSGDELETVSVRWLPSARMTVPDEWQDDYEPGGRLAHLAHEPVVELEVRGCVTGVLCGKATTVDFMRDVHRAISEAMDDDWGFAEP